MDKKGLQRLIDTDVSDSEITEQTRETMKLYGKYGIESAAKGRPPKKRDWNQYREEVLSREIP
tara:strand:+ start:504 stop:692 length:189 start_codon:yes stop_codon:yes gene_type:complete